jgi:ketosteroid isomerase-like protein
MSDATGSEPARDPQELERLLVARQHAGDVAGMVALYVPDAAIDVGGGEILRGREAIREYFAGLVAAGRKFQVGEQRAALVVENLALTSTKFPDGSVSSEIARRQSDGTWLWVVDRFSVE